jgi:deoxyadenosine/deoxycytidine kinase
MAWLLEMLVEAELLNTLGLDTNLASLKVPSYIAVEGPIGVGKTTLAKLLAETFSCETILEDAEENPFLERFYQNRRANALPTQLSFLFQRIQKLQKIKQGELFHQGRVSDFLIEKDPLFARITLDDDEYRLYQTLYDKVIEELPQPDLVVCLQAPTTTLFDRLQRRGNSIERGIDLTYIQTLNDAYTQFFHHYEDTPLLIVNTSEINLAQGNSDYFNLVKYILRGQPGRHYYNPHPIQ